MDGPSQQSSLDDDQYERGHGDSDIKCGNLLEGHWRRRKQ